MKLNCLGQLQYYKYNIYIPVAMTTQLSLFSFKTEFIILHCILQIDICFKI
jgi:hypothetical protein